MNPQMILLLSTDPSVKTIVGNAVTGLEQSLHVVTSCREAMRFLAEEPGAADLAIIDLDPEMHGVTLLADASDRLPILTLTSFEQEYMEPIVLRRGAMGCLEKPITVESVRELIVRALQSNTSIQGGA